MNLLVRLVVIHNSGAICGEEGGSDELDHTKSECWLFARLVSLPLYVDFSSSSLPCACQSVETRLGVLVSTLCCSTCEFSTAWEKLSVDCRIVSKLSVSVLQAMAGRIGGLVGVTEYCP